MPEFQTDVWIIFSEAEIPSDELGRARDIAHELGADEVIDYGELHVKFEGKGQLYAHFRAEAILNRLAKLREAKPCTHPNVKALGIQTCPDCGRTVDHS
tara:strand:+ start:2521 stop:2817 length:297 start_codon:yes stop_codon:yes gene_type:complete